MHTITIQANETGSFEVLINETSYRIHRGLSLEKALQTAEEAKACFNAQGRRARIVRA